ncbi:MAG: MBL fold metallo-hydrolase [Anaerolineales bacterium]|nr:MBL fold metallo-hydrolase [Anaerolineales bacterium]
MKLSFHGAARTVTGSRHLISINGKRLLLDCGLYQGRRKATYEQNLNFPFEPKSVDAAILSHAHIDHSGNLPNFVKQGFVGPIYTTPPTKHLTDIMTRDSGHIQEYDAQFINKKRARQGKPLIEPLYTVYDAIRAAWHLVGIEYDHPFEPVEGVSANLVEAGHILGSAGIILELNEGGKKVRLMFSGDIGRSDLPLLRDPVFPENVDYLIMECTYGDQPHEPVAKAYEDLRDIIVTTVNRGGKIIIPAFAVGRTQSLVYYLHQMIDSGDIQRIPVYVDSPLAINVTDIFRQHSECFSEETLAFMRQDPHGSAFGFDLMHYTRSVEESKAINHYDGPAVIISASGMAETGRILHHLRNNIDDPNNTILITSWMAPHTLGRRLKEGKKNVKIFGEKHKVKSQVVSINGLSAHAGQNALIEYAISLKDRAKGIFLVHGEDGPAYALMEKLAEAGMDQLTYPEMGEEVELV